MTTATAIALHAGITLEGVAISASEIATAKTAFTIRSRKKITTMNRLCARLPTASFVSAPIERASLRTLAQMAPKSWTPAKKIVPSTTQMKAGTQPQITAIDGPMMGAAPATAVKWWPQRTNRFVGT